MAEGFAVRSSALIGLGALGILFGRKMPGVQVIAGGERAARSGRRAMPPTPPPATARCAALTCATPPTAGRSI